MKTYIINENKMTMRCWDGPFNIEMSGMKDDEMWFKPDNKCVRAWIKELEDRRSDLSDAIRCLLAIEERGDWGPMKERIERLEKGE